MKKIKFERSLIDLESIIVNWSNDMERIDYILYEIKDEYREIVRELYNEEKKDNIIYFASLIAKYDLINSLIDMRKKLINDDNLVNDVINRKYVNKIVNVLHDYPGITHSKLAEVINIDKTKLTHTIHRMYDLEIFEKVKNPGKKSVYYYLTNLGYMIYKKIHSEAEENKKIINDLINENYEIRIKTEEIINEMQFILDEKNNFSKDISKMTKKVKYDEHMLYNFTFENYLGSGERTYE